jgi:hypothetical protein
MSSNDDVPALVCSEVVACGWQGGYDDAEPGDDCPECDTGIISTREECPPKCPECGEEEHVESDGCAHKCEVCGWEWGVPSGRGATNAPESLEPEVF